jgi:hypothetical protein
VELLGPAFEPLPQRPHERLALLRDWVPSMDKDYLTLKHAPIGPNEEDYDVLFDGVLVGRIVLSPAASNDRQWMWSLDHRDRSPTRGRADARGGDGGVREALAARVTVGQSGRPSSSPVTFPP